MGFDLPVDADAERRLLGSTWSGLTMNEPEARSVLFDVPPDAFFISDYKRVWTGMQAMAAAMEPLSEVALLWKVSPDGRASEEARSSLLEVLGSGADLTPEPLKVRVLEFFQRRVAIRAAEEVRAAAVDLTLNPEELQTKSNSAFLAVARGVSSPSSRFYSSMELVDQVASGTPFLPPSAAQKLLYFGIPWMDELLVGSPGNVIVLAGRPGAGKTGLGLQARNCTAAAGIKAGFFSLELSKPELQARDAAWWLSDPKRGRIYSYKSLLAQGFNAGEAMEALRGHIPALNNCLSWNHSSGLPMGKLAAYMTEAVHVYGCQLLVLDYFQYIGVTRAKGDTLASAYGANSMTIKRLAQDLGVCVLLLSQLNRETENRPRPVLSDLKETSQLEQDAQAVPMLYRDKDGNLMVTIPKHRDGETILERGLDIAWPCLRFDELVRYTDGEQPGLY